MKIDRNKELVKVKADLRRARVLINWTGDYIKEVESPTCDPLEVMVKYRNVKKAYDNLKKNGLENI